MPGRRGAGRVGCRRADRHRDRDPLGSRRSISPTRSSGSPIDASVSSPWPTAPRPRWPRWGRTRGPPISTSTSSRRSTTSACARSCAGSRSETTPGACTSTSASRAPTARSPSAITCGSCCRRCWPLRPTRRSSTAATPACIRFAPRLFTRSFPRCGVHQPFGDWSTYAEFIEVLKATSTIVEATQLWWSVRPHHSFGTVELRICDAQSDGRGGIRDGGPDRRLHRPVGARLRRGPAGRAARRSPDRREPVARDPPRPGGDDDRLGFGQRGPDRGRDRAA